MLLLCVEKRIDGLDKDRLKLAPLAFGIPGTGLSYVQMKAQARRAWSEPAEAPPLTGRPGLFASILRAHIDSPMEQE